MPMINTFDADKFHAITARFHSKQKFDKQTSAENLRTITVKPDPVPTTSDQKFMAGTIMPNSTIRHGSVMKLDTHMQTNSGDHIYLSSSINPKTDLDISPNINTLIKTDAESSCSSITLQTSRGKLQELKAMHQHLVNLSQAEPDKPNYEPRRPTMESIKKAIERAKKEEIERNKSTATDDLVSTLSTSVSDAVTCTDSKQEIVKKVVKKGHKVKTTTQSGVKRTKKKPKKVEPKVKNG